MKDHAEPDLGLDAVLHCGAEGGSWTNGTGRPVTFTIQMKNRSPQVVFPVVLANGNTIVSPPSVKPARPRRRIRCAAGLALHLLSPVNRQRYREEWAAELADLPRRDQAAHAYRLLSRAWSLRRELSGKPSKAPQVGLAVMVVVPGADAVAAVCGLGWPAAAVGISWGVGVAWTVSDKQRTSNLIDLIKAIRSGKAPTKE